VAGVTWAQGFLPQKATWQSLCLGLIPREVKSLLKCSCSALESGQSRAGRSQGSFWATSPLFFLTWAGRRGTTFNFLFLQNRFHGHSQEGGQELGGV
jgi:hypothetical protein